MQYKLDKVSIKCLDKAFENETKPMIKRKVETESAATLQQFCRIGTMLRVFTKRFTRR